MAEYRSAAPYPESGDSLSGTIAGRFQIAERLGHGGMGEVYRAEDTKLKRSVALKRLGPALRADSIYRRRFQEEAERASRFSDSHVAAVYDVLEERNELFLVMEYVEGQNLRQRLRSAVTLEEFFDIATQCAEALAAAHELRIVHCDIKPENIMLTPAGQVKILDFGVAKHLPRSDQSSTIDRAGSFGGTPAYMAPEVLLEKIPDGRADIFSLGIVLYEALTGNHPFLAGSFVATSERILHETPAPIHIFNDKVPEALEAVVNKALAKDPGLRYQDARALLQDLRLVQAGLTPSKLRPILPIRVLQKSSRWMWLAGGIALVVAVVIFFAYQRANIPPILAERGWVLITDFDSRGESPIPDAGVREGLTIALQQSRYVNVFPRTRVYDVLQRMKRADLGRIDENLGREICQRENLQVLLTGSIEHMGQVFQITVRAVDPVRGDLLFAEQERFNNKEQFFEKADDLTRRVRKDLGESRIGIEKSSKPLARVTTRSLEALQLYSQAKDLMDRGNLDQVLSPLQGALQVDPDFAMAHLLLSSYYSAIVGKNERALQEARHAYDLRQSVTDRERLWIEAFYYSLQERYEDEVQSLLLLVNLHPDDVDAHLGLADAYDNVAGPDKTIPELREVLRLDSMSLTAHVSLMAALAQKSDFQEALSVYQQAQQRGMESPKLHRTLGLTYFGLGDLSKARSEFRIVQHSAPAYEDVGQFYLAMVDIYEGKLIAASGELESVIHRGQAAGSKGLQPSARSLLGSIYLLQHKPTLVKDQADAIMAIPESELQVVDIASAGTLYARAGMLENAKNMLHSLERINQQTPTAWNKLSIFSLRGEIALAQKEPREAAGYFLTAKSAYPQVFVHGGLARASEGQQDWEAAAEQWQEVVAARGTLLQLQMPDELVLAHLYLARDEARLGHGEAARREYEQFLQLWRQSDDLAQHREAEEELRVLDRRLSEPSLSNARN